MILAVDIGNTNLTCGLFDGDLLVKTFRIPSDVKYTVEDYSEFFTKEVGDTYLEGSVICSVVEELNSVIQYSILALFGVKPHILTYKSLLPIKISVPNPSEVGADRIANSVRGYNLFNKAVIIVDFGTATTFDIVDSEGRFVGGLIAPGIQTQLDSLNMSTSKLPNIIAEDAELVIGNNTKNSILSGVIRGCACMVDGMLAQSVNELGETPIVIVTGGYSKLITKYMKTSVETHPYLTLEGIKDVFYMNKPLQPVFKN